MYLSADFYIIISARRLQDYDKCILDAQYYDYVINNVNLEKTIDKIIQIIS